MASLLLLLSIYFAPTIVAALRRHCDRTAIAATNTLLGWTILGWIVALIWAYTGNTEANRKLRIS